MKSKIINLGLPILGLPELLDKDFNCIDVPFKQIMEPIGKEETHLLIKGELNDLYRGDLFLVTQAEFLTDNNLPLIKQLPANNIVIDQTLPVGKAVIDLLEIKNAQYISFKDVGELANQLNKVFYSGQLGYQLNFNNIQFDPYFRGSISQFGHNWIEITDQHVPEFKRVANWDGLLGVAGNTIWEVRPEFKIRNPKTRLRMRVSLISPRTQEIYASQEAENEELKKPMCFEINGDGAFIVTEILVQGEEVDVLVGQISVRKARAGRGTLLIGEHEVMDEESLNEPLYYYFDSGDLKPPLLVYFSGFRFSLGVEGVFMMRQLKAPTLIFGDQRIIGGSFYMGGEKYQAAIIRIIKETLAKLGFDSDELILSGLSMGTYASLYYSSFLDPKWVVVGKPLTSLGDIAANERINRPKSFATSLDMVLRLTGGITENHIDKANDLFWNTFEQRDHSKTNFVFAYMKDDDYDAHAFDRLVKFLKHRSPKSRVLHKGLVGRHNDNTYGIIKYFMSQYKNILTTYYGRDFRPQGGDDNE